MSLFGQTARYLLLTALAIALVGAVGFYTLIHRTIRHEVDEILTSQAKQTELRLKKTPSGNVSDWHDNPRVECVMTPIPAEFTDITRRDSLGDNKPIPVRQLMTTVSAKGQIYLITVQLPYYEFNELAREMSLGVIIGFLLLMALSVTIGLGLSRRLWRPFYSTLDQLGTFRLDQANSPAFPESRIKEFRLLGRSLRELTQKLHRQFLLQKQFTENASHELQTPLAVASAELELLMQSEHLTETDHAHLQHVTDALGRMSQLNRSLLLLTQVENDQFATDDVLNLSELLDHYTDEYEPFFQHKNMTVKKVVSADIHIQMNRQLAVVLLTNLLKNAVRHGGAGHLHAGHVVNEGCVRIELTANALIIQNTGNPLPFGDNLLFNRFVKDPARPDSIGLGLALVKQICDRYGLPLTYQYDAGQEMHSFRIGLLQQRA
ncbi:HAMP domain-containing sensor histidine kinase [soil metagenome]